MNNNIYKHNVTIFEEQTLLTKDDVLLEPQYGIVESREYVLWKDSYLFTAPMDKVTDIEIYKKAIETNIVTPVLARPYLDEFLKYLYYCFNDIDPKWHKYALNLLEKGFISIGASYEDYKKLSDLVNRFEVKHINVAIDIAHGYSKKATEAYKRLYDLTKNNVVLNVMSGSICTEEAAIGLARCGVTHLRVGIGNGAMCSTRLMTGVGVPNLSAVWNIKQGIKGFFPSHSIKIIADGGISLPGDVVKYLAAGADACMVGTAFAGCVDSPAKIVNGNKIQRGQASAEFQLEHYSKVRNDCAEGVERKIPIDIEFLNKVKWFHGGVRSACSYLGLENIHDLNPKNVKFNKVSFNTLRENNPI